MFINTHHLDISWHTTWRVIVLGEGRCHIWYMYYLHMILFFPQVLPTCSNKKSGNLELKTEPGSIWRGVLYTVPQIDSLIMAGGCTSRKHRNRPCLLRTNPLDCNSHNKWQNQKTELLLGYIAIWSEQPSYYATHDSSILLPSVFLILSSSCPN